MRPEEFNLRPIEERDLDLVLSWRNSERVRSYMYTDHLIAPEEHRAWFARSRDAEFPATLIFEYQGRPVGLKSFNQIDRHSNRCHWGFYLGDLELPRGCGTVMGFLAQEYIFERQGFRKLCAEAFAFNEGSIKYHTRLGFAQEGRLVRHVLKNGCYEDVVVFGTFKENWLANKEALAAKIFREDAAQ
ncbi:UDP-4-amino-4,6-dideoxy-N-acetyl-beta-L-altrosamine N-acetyltransferase [Geomonas azotofigens]|uniref:UDP-4-amino-4, 6-dideoxy-N-acetyl-beta-L-altrosamine N-acetyltransferase n=1 Tax=Geomonas azotofigens TaxID=2843196 RepID=UPI001C127C0C|nr:UDP-4-amino-4,6-dideoxy-N-acetyl-beta-L-altrosamine N-acetyltransferase [Geomonas azotofigens]MBU5615102.1 UDP-4-amino-4,6-dideoxy-N-acetyl-beta-L-altrosamine N-acetyltransferase [Geomonas azotofigens]